jgi:hypothetical protein
MATACKVPLQTVSGVFEKIGAYDEELELEFVWDKEFATDFGMEEIESAIEEAELSEEIIESASASNLFSKHGSRRKKARRNLQIQVFFGVSVFLALVLGLFGGYYFATRLDKPRINRESQMESGEFEAIQAYLKLGD